MFENIVLKEQMKSHRLLLTDDQRRHLTAKGKRISRQALNRVVPTKEPTHPLQSPFRRAFEHRTSEPFRVHGSAGDNAGMPDASTMIASFRLVLKDRTQLALEIIGVRQQLAAYKRTIKRPKIEDHDRSERP